MSVSGLENTRRQGRVPRGSKSFPADENNPTPEELAEIERRIREVQSTWSEETRENRLPNRRARVISTFAAKAAGFHDL